MKIFVPLYVLAALILVIFSEILRPFVFAARGANWVMGRFQSRVKYWIVACTMYAIEVMENTHTQ